MHFTRSRGVVGEACQGRRAGASKAASSQSVGRGERVGRVRALSRKRYCMHTSFCLAAHCVVRFLALQCWFLVPCVCVDERGWSGVRPDGRIPFFACPKKGIKKRAPRPVRPPSGAALRYSSGRAGCANSDPSGLRQAHPETPAPPALLGSLHGDPGWCRGTRGFECEKTFGVDERRDAVMWLFISDFFSH